MHYYGGMKKHNKEPLTIEDLNLLKQSKQPEARQAIAQKIGFHFDSSSQESEEYHIASEIAFYLQEDDEVPVRIALAESMHKSEHAPHQLVILLAQDEEDAVAIPVLKDSPVITKDDLIHLLPKIDKESRLVAVAERKYLSVTVSSLLVERNIENVVLSLLKNHSAIVDDDVILQIAYKYSRSSAILERMLKRMPLPISAVNHMVEIQQSHEQNNVPVCEIKSFTVIEKDELKNDLFTLMFLGQNPSQETCSDMIEQMKRQNKVTATFMLLSMCLGQENFFNSCMAHNTGLPLTQVEALCNAGQQEFFMLMNKSGVSPSLYPLMFHTYQGMQKSIDKGFSGGTAEFGEAMIECLLAAESQNINFATTLGKPLAKVLKETLF